MQLSEGICDAMVTISYSKIIKMPKKKRHKSNPHCAAPYPPSQPNPAAQSSTQSSTSGAVIAAGRRPSAKARGNNQNHDLALELLSSDPFVWPLRPSTPTSTIGLETQAYYDEVDATRPRHDAHGRTINDKNYSPIRPSSGTQSSILPMGSLHRERDQPPSSSTLQSRK
jgi:hypothetical protein